MARLPRPLATSDNVEMNSRWLRVTPDRFLLGMLLVECLHWLSKPWFAKGWAPLVAVAAVGTAVLLMLFWLTVCAMVGRRFQFSIRSLFVLVLAVAIPSAWLAAEMERARRQTELVDWIKSLGGSVQYDWNFTPDYLSASAQPPPPTWLRTTLGDDFFFEIEGVQLNHKRITDADLQRLQGLPRVRLLEFADTAIGDAGLDHLTGLSELHWLWLGWTRVTDAGINRLKQALPNCNVYH